MNPFFILLREREREREQVWENRKEKEVCDGRGTSARLLFTCFQHGVATRDPFPLILLSLTHMHTHTKT